MADWQPIETAPIDQRPILGCHLRSESMAVTWRAAFGSGLYVRHGERDGRGWHPTHFMPLPQPPEGE